MGPWGRRVGTWWGRGDVPILVRLGPGVSSEPRFGYMLFMNHVITNVCSATKDQLLRQYEAVEDRAFFKHGDEGMEFIDTLRPYVERI